MVRLVYDTALRVAPLSLDDPRMKLYTCTDREDVIYRRWITTEANARLWAHRFVWGWTLRRRLAPEPPA